MSCDQEDCKSTDAVPEITFKGGNRVFSVCRECLTAAAMFLAAKPYCCSICGFELKTPSGVEAPSLCAACASDKPKAAVAYIKRDDGKMLVVWNKRYGKWGFPGGRVEAKDGNPRNAVIREVLEEVDMHTLTEELVYVGPSDPDVLQRDVTRGHFIFVYLVTLRYNPTISFPFSHPKEMEPGCPVTWFTREEFLLWCIAPKFYTRMFEKLDKDAREKLLHYMPVER